jgi:DNA polymerase-4
MDAFFASIEQAINPRLKGKPLIVGARNNKSHTVVCAASYEAKALGIHSGMSSQEALRICPQLNFVFADQSKYLWTSQKILEFLNSLEYPVNYVSIDEFQLDIGKSPPQPIINAIQEAIRGMFHITASIGGAKNFLLAKLASKLNKPNGSLIITEINLPHILGQTPAEKLCGIGEQTQSVLNQIGIKTCLELYAKDMHFLKMLLGKYGLNLYQSLHTEESFLMPQENENPQSIGHSYTFPRASANTGFIQAWIRLLSEMVAIRLRQNLLVSSTTSLWMNTPEKPTLSGQKTFSQATNDGLEIYYRSLKIMAKISHKTSRIRALGITCSKLSQTPLDPLFLEQKRREALLKTIDRINHRFGEFTIHPAIIALSRKMK